jgi:hypothetical protein
MRPGVYPIQPSDDDDAFYAWCGGYDNNQWDLAMRVDAQRGGLYYDDNFWQLDAQANDNALGVYQRGSLGLAPYFSSRLSKILLVVEYPAGSGNFEEQELNPDLGNSNVLRDLFQDDAPTANLSGNNDQTDWFSMLHIEHGVDRTECTQLHINLAEDDPVGDPTPLARLGTYASDGCITQPNAVFYAGLGLPEQAADLSGFSMPPAGVVMGNPEAPIALEPVIWVYVKR